MASARVKGVPSSLSGVPSSLSGVPSSSISNSSSQNQDVERLQRQREQARIRQQRRRENLSEDQRQQDREQDRIRRQSRRENMSEDQHQQERLSNQLTHETARQVQSPADRQSVREVNRLAHDTARQLQSPADRQSVREVNRLAHETARQLQSPEQHQAELDMRNSNRQPRQPNANVDRIPSMPMDYPSSGFLGEFERDPVAAQAMFWGRTHNWQFVDYIDYNFDQNHPANNGDSTVPATMDTSGGVQDNGQLADAIRAEASVTDQTVERCVERYSARMDPTQPLQICASCGPADVSIAIDRRSPNDPILKDKYHCIRTFISDIHLSAPRLRALEYTEAENARYNVLVPPHVDDTPENQAFWIRYRNMHSSVLFVPPGDGQIPIRFHLYPQHCHDNYITLCTRCDGALRGNDVPGAPLSRPPLSIAAGYDLGSPSAIEPPLPQLSFSETLCISRRRVLNTNMNIFLQQPTGNTGAYNSFTGHCIVFSDLAADTCGAVMPDAAFAAEGQLVTIEGPSNVIDHLRLDGLIRTQLGVLRVDGAHVLDWLRCLYFVNPEYSTIQIRADIQTELDNFQTRLIDNAIRLPWTSQTEQSDAARAQSDVTRPREGPQVTSVEVDDVNSYLANLRPSTDLQPQRTILLQVL